MSAFGVLGLWPKAVMQAIALNSMAYENGARWMCPVFAGDLNRNLALHKDMHEVTGSMYRVVAAAAHPLCTCCSDCL